MMISGSTPFSFAMASICCSNGLTVAIFLKLQSSQSEFHLEPAALDLRERHPVGPASLFEPYDAVLHASETSRKRRLAVYRLARHHFGEPSCEPAVVGRMPQRPVEPWRGNLERVRLTQRRLFERFFLDVEQ